MLVWESVLSEPPCSSQFSVALFGWHNNISDVRILNDANCVEGLSCCCKNMTWRSVLRTASPPGEPRQSLLSGSISNSGRVVGYSILQFIHFHSMRSRFISRDAYSITPHPALWNHDRRRRAITLSLPDEGRCRSSAVNARRRTAVSVSVSWLPPSSTTIRKESAST